MKIEEIPNAFAETLKECLEESELTQKEISYNLGIPASHLTEMKQGKRRCTAEYDLRLSRYYNTSEGFWLGLQSAYQLRVAKVKKGRLIKKEVQPV